MAHFCLTTIIKFYLKNATKAFKVGYIFKKLSKVFDQSAFV